MGDSVPLFSCGRDVSYPLIMPGDIMIMLTPSCKRNTKLSTVTLTVTLTLTVVTSKSTSLYNYI